MNALIWLVIVLAILVLIALIAWFLRARRREVFHFSLARTRYGSAKIVAGTRWQKQPPDGGEEQVGPDDLGTYTFVGPGIAVRYRVEGMTETIVVELDELDTLTLDFVDAQLNGMRVGRTRLPSEHPDLRCNKNAARNFRSVLRRDIGLYVDPMADEPPPPEKPKKKLFYGRPGEQAPKKPKKRSTE